MGLRWFLDLRLNMVRYRGTGSLIFLLLAADASNFSGETALAEICLRTGNGHLCVPTTFVVPLLSSKTCLEKSCSHVTIRHRSNLPPNPAFLWDSLGEHVFPGLCTKMGLRCPLSGKWQKLIVVISTRYKPSFFVHPSIFN